MVLQKDNRPILNISLKIIHSFLIYMKYTICI